MAEGKVLTVYVSIGNSDDRLTQARWSDFWGRVAAAIQDRARVVHGQFLSTPESRWQNACWCFEIPEGDEVLALMLDLAEAAHDFEQDSIAWSLVGPEGTQFIRGMKP